MRALKQKQKVAAVALNLLMNNSDTCLNIVMGGDDDDGRWREVQGL